MLWDEIYNGVYRVKFDTEWFRSLTFLEWRLYSYVWNLRCDHPFVYRKIKSFGPFVLVKKDNINYFPYQWSYIEKLEKLGFLFSVSSFDKDYTSVGELVAQDFTALKYLSKRSYDGYILGVHSPLDGSYVGMPEDVDWLLKIGVNPLTIQNRKHLWARKSVSDSFITIKTVSSNIGFIPKTSQWVGWSHKAFARYKIGDQVKVNDCGNKLGSAFTVNSLSEAKQCACSFAEEVA